MAEAIKSSTGLIDAMFWCNSILKTFDLQSLICHCNGFSNFLANKIFSLETKLLKPAGIF